MIGRVVQRSSAPVRVLVVDRQPSPRRLHHRVRTRIAALDLVEFMPERDVDGIGAMKLKSEFVKKA